MSSPLAILPKWPVYDNDMDIKDSIRFFEIVKQRPIVKILNIADYDHDGRATEFILQVGAQSCGHEQTIMVGISKNNPSLHVFGSIAHPDSPLTFQRPEIWKALLQSKGDTTVVEWPCGDHGAEEEDRIEFHTTSKGIQVFRLIYSCESKHSAQKLLSREEL